MKLSLILISCLLISTCIAAQPPKPDTLIIDGVEVIRDNEEYKPEPDKKKGFFKDFKTKITPKNAETEWMLIDLGFSNVIDRTDYTGTPAQDFAPGADESWFAMNTFKSRNVNVWIVSQRLSVLRDVVSLKYRIGMELNNYHFKQPIRFIPNDEISATAPVVQLDPLAIATPATREYKKNKLAADYVTVPAMLHFNFTPGKLYNIGLSAGVSVGYLYASRNKTVTSDEGKKKAKDDFELRPWKFSYIGELDLGIFTLYGTYAIKSMFKRGLDMTPYNVGIRINPKGAFDKINLR